MKKILTITVLTILFAGNAIMANGTTNKPHRKLKGKADAKINCIYCHKTAGIEKKKGQDLNQLYRTDFCAGSACHK